MGLNNTHCYTSMDLVNPVYTHLTQCKRGSLINPDIVHRALAESVDDTLAIAFYIRGGRGERKIFRDIMRIILKEKPELASAVIPRIPKYGRWDDVWSLMGLSDEVDSIIDETVLEQFRCDQESQFPSLLAKWLPRERGTDPLPIHFANLFFPLTPFCKGQRLRVYRKTLSYMNLSLNTTEVKMCKREWSFITPESVPAQLMKRNKDAFLNKKTLILTRGHVDRYPDSRDRVMCADTFKGYTAAAAAAAVNTRSCESLQTILESPHYRISK